MDRIMVVGISAGVGKSTFAKELGELIEIDVYHLDSYNWKPNWIASTYEEFALAQREIVEKRHWIIEGNYRSTFDIRLEKADTLIYLELPIYVCLFRVIKRWLCNLGKTRPDMGEGCKEKMDWKFIRFILTTYYPRKQKMQQDISEFLLQDSNRTVIHFKNKREVRDYLNKK